MYCRQRVRFNSCGRLLNVSSSKYCLFRILNLSVAKQKSIVSLENKHYDLGEAFREKSKALQETQAKYQSLKGQLMTAEQQSAASDEAEHALHANLGINSESHIIQGYPLGLSARSHQPRPLQTRLPRPIHEMRTQGSHVESQAQS